MILAHMLASVVTGLVAALLGWIGGFSFLSIIGFFVLGEFLGMAVTAVHATSKPVCTSHLPEAAGPQASLRELSSKSCAPQALH